MTSDSSPTVVVIVFVSIGSVFFVGLFLVAAIFCFLKRRNKKKNIEKRETVHVEEHKKIKEVIVEGPHGTQSVVVSFEDDIHIGEKIEKKERVEESLNDKSALANDNASSSSTSVAS